ncbi:hypothetical protein ACU4IU_12625 [Brevibacterium sp. CSND-B09]|uniref:hypothetical protein n=1 Tax=Brevibacterium sp. CSND-B09 TaxID=3462571 RepID=UPI00406AAEC4
MTIYDVPVSDTEFFPVSGDMLRLMKHEEQQAEIRARDRAIRAHMPPHRAEHLIGLLNENDLGTPAKKSPEAADLNTHQGEQTVMNDTGILPGPADTDASRWHPLWCDPTDDNCYVNDDVEHHESHAGLRYGFDAPHGALTGQVRRYSWDNEALLSVVVEKSGGESLEFSWWELKKLHNELLPRMLHELEYALGQES